MKVLIVIFAVINIIVAIPQENKQEEANKKAEEYVKFCIDDTGISEENANKIKAGDFSVRDEKTQCFTHCFFKQAGFVNEQGEPQPDVMISKLAHKTDEKNEGLEELVKKCIKEKGETECETSFRIYECYRGGATYGKQ